MAQVSRPQAHLRAAEMLEIEFVVRPGQRPPRAFLKKWLPAITKELLRVSSGGASVVGKRRAQQMKGVRHISLVFVSVDEIQRLNQQYRRKNRPTDVLSFSPTEPDSLGELVFSIDVLKRQAKDHQLTLNTELGYMVLHGVLHLLGYDHERSVSESKRMFRIQDKVFDAVLSRW